MTIRRLAAVAKKEWKETVRNRLFLLMAFLLPPLWMVVFGYGLVLDVERVPFAVVDRDRSPLSRDYVYRFIESRYFDYRGTIQDEREIEGLLGKTAIRLAIIVSEGFQGRLSAGRPTTVQILLDGSFPLHADITKSYVLAINRAFSRDLLTDFLVRTRGMTRDEASRLLEPVTVETRYLYNEEVRGTWSIVPALIMFALMVSPPILTALGMVREKETGSIYTMYGSTASKGDILLGKLAPYCAISMINVVVLWATAVWLFDVPFKGNVVVFFVASVLFVLCSTGMGLVVSLLVRTQMAALIITIIIAMVPTILYSGLLVPVSSLGLGARLQAHAFPAMYYTDVVRASFLKRFSLHTLWLDILALAGFAGAILLLAHRLFTKRPNA
ncbi:MAG: ABC transporter permease [Nitrospira sp.]|nr:ABC transporter permease [Nitrospira sp.]MCP9464571.1 ABC transporter permease [Nitrospira sp.]